MSGLSVDELSRAFANRLLQDAQPVCVSAPRGIGLRVNLEKNPAISKPHLITTAEAIVALAPHRQRNREKFDALVVGLDHLWNSKTALSNRHRGWYCLATVAADRADTLCTLLTTALGEAPKKGEPWCDDPQRRHEIYSSWIMTWALVEALHYLSDKTFAQTELLRSVAHEGVDFILASLVTGPGETFGLPFTRVTDRNRQRRETEPNPAMTAYGLSLLGSATRSFGKEVWTPDALKALDALAAWDNRGVWDSYREPYEPNSMEGDFEHFTTCWVANALWRAVAAEVVDNESARRRAFLKLARAIAALTQDLRPTGEGEAGLIYVDRGSLRDYSFAVADFLMFLNLTAETRAQLGNTLNDDVLQKVISTAAIDRLVFDVNEFAPLSAAYGEYERVVSGLKQAATSAASEVVTTQERLRSLCQEEAEVQRGLESAKAALNALRVHKVETIQRIDTDWRRDTTLLCFNWLDAVCLVVWTTLLCGYALTSTAGILPNLFGSGVTLTTTFVALLGLFAASTVAAGIVHETKVAVQRGSVSSVHVAIILAAALSVVSFFLRALQATPNVENAGLLTGLMVPLSGLVLWNFRLHYRRWRRLEGTVAS